MIPELGIRPLSGERPRVFTVRHVFASAFAVPEAKEKTAMLVAAAIICAIRTARADRIVATSPRIIGAVADSFGSRA
jgi:hypothetical protein